MKKYIPLLCLTVLFCTTLAAADFQTTPLNCHEMSELTFGGRESAELLSGAGGPGEAALADYFSAREAAYRGDARLFSGDDWNASSAVAEENELRAESVRDMETRLGLTVLDADVTARIERERTVQNPDGTWTMYVYEWTFFDYDDLADGVGGLDVSGFGTWHIFTVDIGADGACEVLSDEYDESDILGVNTLSDAHTRELLARAVPEPEYESEPDAASLLAFSYYPDYDVEKAVAYSEEHWNNYNPAYANFNPYGGDCANFTSQSIYAGGMPQVVTKAYANDGWFYINSTNRSATWTGATNLHHWMRDNRGRCVTASATTVYTGSPVFYSKTTYSGDSKQENISFAHAVLCVGTNTAGSPIINSHNTDRYHVMWNYYTGSKTIDTVQLTSKSFGSFSGYVRLNEDFHAYIINPSLSRYVTNDGGGSVTSRAGTEESGQVWRFIRQSDSSYEIVSVLRGETIRNPALAAEDSGWASRTPVRIEPYDASPGQQWYIYQTTGDYDWGPRAYQFRPKCSDRVMDIVEGSDAEGTGLWIFSRNGTEAQLFQLYETEWITIDTPVLSAVLEGGEGANVRFSWESLEGAASYVLRVTQGETEFPAVTVRRNTSHGMRLEPGTYEATLEAVSANEKTSSMSEPITFTVYTSYTIHFDANGGAEPPEDQMKIEGLDTTLTGTVPVYPGYVFSSWNTEANGTGDSYEAGDVYDRDENITLYARWELATYTVTLNPNHGELLEESATVTYSEPYGILPTPTREQYEFAGWYTELDGGERITEQSTVTLTDDHTLYAHWDSTVAYISSFVTRMGSYHVVHTTAYRITNGVLLVCGYLNGQMVDVASGEPGNSDGVTLDGDFDTIRVFAVDADTHKPLCPRNTILERDFRG